MDRVHDLSFKLYISLICYFLNPLLVIYYKDPLKLIFNLSSYPNMFIKSNTYYLLLIWLLRILRFSLAFLT